MHEEKKKRKKKTLVALRKNMQNRVFFTKSLTLIVEYSGGLWLLMNFPGNPGVKALNKAISSVKGLHTT